MKNLIIGTIILFLSYFLQLSGCTGMRTAEETDANGAAAETQAPQETALTGTFFERAAALLNEGTAETPAASESETTAAETAAPAETATPAKPAPTAPAEEPTQPAYEEPVQPVYVEPVTEAPTEAPTEPPTAAPVPVTPPPTEAPTEPPATEPPTEAPTEPVHVHSWVPVTEYIHHDAQYVHHDAVYHTETWDEQVLVQDAWDEPVYEIHSFCTVCGADITWVDPGDHAFEKHDGASGWHDESVQVDTIHHEAVYETVTHEEQVKDSDAWDELVAEAWEEEIVTGYVCSGCGERQ